VTCSPSRGRVGAQQLAGKTTGRGRQHTHDVRMLEVDDVAFSTEALERRQSVFDGAMEALDGHCAVAVHTQVDRAESATANLSFQSHLNLSNMARPRENCCCCYVSIS